MNTINKCPHCKTGVDPEASICPHCRGKIYQWTFTKIFIAGGIGIIVLLMLIGSFFSSSSTSSTATNAPVNRKIDSIGFAEYMIKDLLKAPSTAKFVDVNAYELTDQKDVWVVTGYVDSQNSFGAMIRNSWKIQFDYRDGKGGEITNIIFDGKKIK